MGKAKEIKEVDPFAPFWERDEPDYINDLGIKWWVDKDLTKYARNGNINGTKLEKFGVWVVAKPNGYKTRILVNEKNQALYETPSLESMATKIDMLKLVKEKCG